MGELLILHPALWQYSTLKPAHVEEKVRVVLAVDGHEAALPLGGGDGAGKTVLYVPEHSTTAEQEEGLK